MDVKESVFKKEKEDTPEYENRNERKSLKQLKTDMLNILLEKESLLNNVSRETEEKIFNVMTLEAVKTLKMMLKFGIFEIEEDELPTEDVKLNLNATSII